MNIQSPSFFSCNFCSKLNLLPNELQEMISKFIFIDAKSIFSLALVSKANMEALKLFFEREENSLKASLTPLKEKFKLISLEVLDFEEEARKKIEGIIPFSQQEQKLYRNHHFISRQVELLNQVKAGLTSDRFEKTSVVQTQNALGVQWFNKQLLSLQFRQNQVRDIEKMIDQVEDMKKECLKYV